MRSAPLALVLIFLMAWRHAGLILFQVGSDGLIPLFISLHYLFKLFMPSLFSVLTLITMLFKFTFINKLFQQWIKYKLVDITVHAFLVNIEFTAEDCMLI